MKTIYLLGVCLTLLASCTVSQPAMVSKPAVVVRPVPQIVYSVPVISRVVVPGYRNHYSIPKSGVSMRWRVL